MARRKTGRSPIAVDAGRKQGLVKADPAGRPAVVPFAEVPGLIGLTPIPPSIGGLTGGAQGEDGADGPPGIQGPPGAAGAAGAPGVSVLSVPYPQDGEDGEPAVPIPGPAGPTGASGAMFLIEEVNPSGTGVVTFSSLGSYTHLKIVYSARGTQVATATSINLTFNGDTGSNYDAQRSVFSTTTSLADQVAQASAIIANISAASAPASYATGGEITVHDYRGTTFFKQAFCAQAGALVAQSTTNINTRLFSAWWRSTAAITSITLTLTSGNYVAGSKFSLYGIL